MDGTPSALADWLSSGGPDKLTPARSPFRLPVSSPLCRSLASPPPPVTLDPCQGDRRHQSDVISPRHGPVAPRLQRDPEKINISVYVLGERPPLARSHLPLFLKSTIGLYGASARHSHRLSVQSVRRASGDECVPYGKLTPCAHTANPCAGRGKPVEDLNEQHEQIIEP